MNKSMFQKGLAVALLLSVVVSLTFAAPDQGQQGQRGQGRGGAYGGGWGGMGGFGGQGMGGFGGQGMGGFDIAALLNSEALQKRILLYYKEQLGATDEEWTVLEPRMSKVLQLTQETNAIAGMITSAIRGFADRFSRAQGGQAEEEKSEEQSAVEKATLELEETIGKEAPSSAEIKAKITALRGAKEKARQQLLDAQNDLREVLTLKQEARLILLGMLE